MHVMWNSCGLYVNSINLCVNVIDIKYLLRQMSLTCTAVRLKKDIKDKKD